jgi:hypothetical protein
MRAQVMLWYAAAAAALAVILLAAASSATTFYLPGVTLNDFAKVGYLIGSMLLLFLVQQLGMVVVRVSSWICSMAWGSADPARWPMLHL